MDDVIIISDSDKESPQQRTKQQNKLVKRPLELIDSSSDSDVQVVSHLTKDQAHTPKFRPIHQFISQSSNEDVECIGSHVGVRALADYPHFRFHCLIHPFKRQRYHNKLKTCQRCFCYVCDIPAYQCQEWNQHAKAVDSLQKWRNERNRRLQQRRKHTNFSTQAYTNTPTTFSSYQRPLQYAQPLYDHDTLPQDQHIFDSFSSDYDDHDHYTHDDHRYNNYHHQFAQELFNMGSLKHSLTANINVMLSAQIRNQNRRKTLDLDTLSS